MSDSGEHRSGKPPEGTLTGRCPSCGGPTIYRTDWVGGVGYLEQEICWARATEESKGSGDCQYRRCLRWDGEPVLHF